MYVISLQTVGYGLLAIFAVFIARVSITSLDLTRYEALVSWS